MEYCDSCKTVRAAYKENEYTVLCAGCWMGIADNTLKNLREGMEDPAKRYNNTYVWVFDSKKVLPWVGRNEKA